MALAIKYFSDIGSEFWHVLSEMSPYLLFGFLVAGLLAVLISAEKVERHLGGRRILPVIKASLFGIPLPLCSCGVIPVAASLRRSGAGRGATASFLISTPQTGVDSILVTFSLLGPVFAVFRPVAALVTGLAGGFIASALDTDENEGAQDLSAGDCGCEEDSCQGDEEKRGRAFRALHYGFVALPRDIGRALLVGLVIAGVISALIPEDFFAKYLGAGILPMLVMIGVGLPVYVCATASVPIAAALIAAGITPGAALVFLMTGPASNAATVSTIWRVAGKRTVIIYLATVAAGALAGGLALDYIFNVTGAVASPEAHAIIPDFIKPISAVVLLLVLLHALIRPAPKTKVQVEGEEGSRVTLRVSGMRCSHCSESVQRALSGTPGVERATVDLEAGKAYVSGRELDVDSLCHAIDKLGYEASPEDRPDLRACARE